MNGDVGPLFAQRIDHPHQVLVSAQGSVGRAVTKPGDKHVLGGRLADDQRKVLVLLEVSVEKRQLLMAVSRIVRGVQIQRDRGGQPAAVLVLQPPDAAVDQKVDQPLQHRGSRQVLKTAERRLAGQRLALRMAVGDQLEDRILPQRVVIIAVLVAGQTAKESLPQH